MTVALLTTYSSAVKRKGSCNTKRRRKVLLACEAAQPPSGEGESVARVLSPTTVRVDKRGHRLAGHLPRPLCPLRPTSRPWRKPRGRQRPPNTAEANKQPPAPFGAANLN